MPARIKYPVVDGMKECGDCHQMKPIEMYRPARSHYESRCSECKKAYAAEYRKRPEVVENARRYHAEYNRDPDNRAKKNEYIRRWRKLPHAKDKRNETRRNWAAREKQKAVDYKGGKCVCCGYSDCLAAMEFHHRDPEEKEGYGGGALKAHWSFERNKPEIDKCELVCNRCHREIHAGVRSI